MNYISIDKLKYIYLHNSLDDSHKMNIIEDKHKLIKHLDNLLILFDKSFQSNSEQKN